MRISTNCNKKEHVSMNFIEMHNTNCLLLDDCLNDKQSELPLLENDIFHDFTKQNFEIDHFLTPVSSNHGEQTSNDLISISQNCSYDSVSVESSNDSSSSSRLVDYPQYTFSSASSSTSEVYSPIQITPPETPPSCETLVTNQTNISANKQQIKRASNRESKNNTQVNSKKKKLLPLAPKTQTVTLIPIHNTTSSTSNVQKMVKLPVIMPSSVNDLLKSNSNCLTISQTTNNTNNRDTPQYTTSSLDDLELSKEELSKMKEKARRQRNRQSAMLSRQKKMDHVKSIEKRLEELNDENKQLRNENHRLKDLVNKLTFENGHLKSLRTGFENMASEYLKYPLESSPTSKKTSFSFFNKQSTIVNDTTKAKKTISLLAVIFLIGLNMNLYQNDNFKSYESNRPLSIDAHKSSQVSASSSSGAFKGRVLLWSDNLDISNHNNKTSINSTTNCSNQPQRFISQNETLILESKLRNWAIHQTSKQQFYSANGRQLDDASNDRLSWYSGIRNWNQFYGSKKRYSIDTDDQRQQLNYDQIISSVRPKDNTYYFLSLNPSDHLILPLDFYSNKSKNDGTLRPKFSLLIPTLNSQFSANFASFARNSTNKLKNNNSFLQMIEIDFEVINMKPIQISKRREFHTYSNGVNRFTNRRNLGRSFTSNMNQDKVIAGVRTLKPIKSRNQTTKVQSVSQSNRTIHNLNS